MGRRGKRGRENKPFEREGKSSWKAELEGKGEGEGEGTVKE